MKLAVVDLAAPPERALVGSKAYHLATLKRAGFNVPDGFVVTTAAGALNARLQEQILGAFDRLQTDRVAVRSSAGGEDSQGAAWAGQMDTYLNVGRAELLEKIKACRKSLHSTRANAYAEQKGVTPGKAAVLVQRMVNSEIAGVAFSANPVTQAADQIVIEAAYGLGEAVVSGEITPDNYIVAKDSGELIDTYVATQPKKLVRNADGATAWTAIETGGDAQKLSEVQIGQLAAAVQKIETFFGFPVDVEWAFAAGELFILQSRPITTMS
jgi:pyruvate,water dikinase